MDSLKTRNETQRGQRPASAPRKERRSCKSGGESADQSATKPTETAPAKPFSSDDLNLLLKSIQEEEADIFKISVHEIIGVFLKQLYKKPDMDQAGDFIRPAARLLLVKSRALLPSALEEEEGEEEAAEAKSVRQERWNERLHERLKYKSAGEIMAARNLLGRDVFAAPEEGRAGNHTEDKIRETEISREEAPFVFAKTCAGVFAKRIKRSSVPVSPIPPLTSRIRDMASCLTKGMTRTFRFLAEWRRGEHTPLLTFLSLLELSRLGFVSLSQISESSEIKVRTEKEIDESVFQFLDPEED